MSRHSKNATATMHFTYHERAAAGHGTLKRRFGRDAQLSFGVCCLCLASTRGRSPLASPAGFVYCKECIYANLLAQKRAIQENTAAYARFLEAHDRKAQDAALQQERDTLRKALDAAEGQQSMTAASSSSSLEPQERAALATRKLQEKVDAATDNERCEAMKRTSFWIPECTPSQETTVAMPDTKTRDPMSLDEMKLKHLLPIKFEWDAPGDNAKEAHVLCAVTKKEISHRRAVLLRPSGQVVLESCLKDMVLPSMTCPVTGLKLRKQDIVHLQAGGTGFSAHSTVQAKNTDPP